MVSNAGPDAAQKICLADICYVGQAHYIEVPLDTVEPDAVLGGARTAGVHARWSSLSRGVRLNFNEPYFLRPNLSLGASGERWFADEPALDEPAAEETTAEQAARVARLADEVR